MNKYLISLDKDVQRRELFFAQPDTADFVVFSAINTMQKEWDELAEVFNPTKFEQHYGRNVTKGEIGCTLSHLAVYRQIVEDQNVTENDYALVCEDDALFNSNLSPKTIALLTEKCDADIVLIGQSKIAEFDDVELEINYPTTFSFLRYFPKFFFTAKIFLSGYLINFFTKLLDFEPRIASKLLTNCGFSMAISGRTTLLLIWN